MHKVNEILKYTKELNILYVEDDESIRDSTTTLLKLYFKNVDIAVDGEDGLQKYKVQAFLYDIVVTDIEMPNLCGIRMAEKILEIDDSQHIIFITAHNEFEKLYRIISLGADGYLTKPINSDQLQRLFYKCAKIINNDKFIKSHSKLMEKMSLQLKYENDDLAQENIELKKLYNELLASFKVKV